MVGVLAWMACADSKSTGEPTLTEGDTDIDTLDTTDTDIDPDTDVCGVIPTFADGISPLVEIHVSPTGSDATGDGSAGAPYATLDRAVDDAGPGASIVLAPGTYPGGTWIEELRGTASAPIWIGGAPGQRPVVEGGSSGLMLSRVSHLVIHDLLLSGASQSGLNCDDGGDYASPLTTHHVVFRDLVIRDVGSGGNEDCLKLSGVDEFVVLDSEFDSCGDEGSGIDHVGCHHGIVARNAFYDAGSSAVQTKGGSEDIEIRWNTIVGTRDRALNLGGSTDLQYFRPPVSSSGNTEARDIRAVANVLAGGDAAIAFVGCVDCLAAHNTIVDPQHWTIRILQETVDSAFLPASGGRVVNNLVSFERAVVSADVNVGPDVDAESFAFETNWFYAWDDPGASAPDLPGTESGTMSGADPLLDFGYGLQPGSPAVGVGTPGVDTLGDLAGACWAATPAVGAFEG